MLSYRLTLWCNCLRSDNKTRISFRQVLYVLFPHENITQSSRYGWVKLTIVDRWRFSQIAKVVLGGGRINDVTSHLAPFANRVLVVFHSSLNANSRRGGLEVAGRTVDREIRVRFPALPSSRVSPPMARRLMKSSDVLHPCRVSLAHKRPIAAHGVGARQRVKIWNWTTVPLLYSWNITECDITTTNQQLNANVHFGAKSDENEVAALVVFQKMSNFEKQVIVWRDQWHFLHLTLSDDNVPWFCNGTVIQSVRKGFSHGIAFPIKIVYMTTEHSSVLFA